jgi:hypothetical protein
MNKKSTLVLVGCAAMTIAIVVWANSQKVPVVPKPDYAAMIRVHGEQAHQRNRNAFELFETDVDRIVQAHRPGLEDAATRAASESADFASCCKVVYYLAWDKAKGGSSTEEYLNSQIQPILEPEMESLASDLEKSVHALDLKLQESTLKFAKELAALRPNGTTATIAIESDDVAAQPDFQQALQNLGYNATGIGASAAFDAIALSQTTLAGWKRLASALPALAGKLFGKQVAKAGASAVAPFADGPLPVGEVLGVIGGLWTAYDISQAQQEFKAELKTSLDNLVNETDGNVRKQALDHAEDAINHYQSTQESISNQALADLTGVLSQHE